MSRWGRLLSFALVLTGAATLAADSETEALRAEVRAMKQAYEGRISALESELKDVKSGATDRSKRETDRHIDEALKKTTGAQAAITARGLPPGTAPVQSASKLTLGGYAEFAYIDRGDRTAE